MVRRKTFYCQIIPDDPREPQWIPVVAVSPAAASRMVRAGTNAPVEVRAPSLRGR